jgi:hypothetical protein
MRLRGSGRWQQGGSGWGHVDWNDDAWLEEDPYAARGAELVSFVRQRRQESDGARRAALWGAAWELPQVSVPAPITCNGELSGTVRAKVNNQDVVFNVCVEKIGFNPTRGEVTPNAMSDIVEFSCRYGPKNTMSGPVPIPAWGYEAFVTSGGPGIGDPLDWRYGFLETVRRSTWLAIYSDPKSGRRTPRKCEIKDARRVLSSNTSPPQFYSSQILDPTLNDTVSLVDTPSFSFAVKHPTAPSQTLSSVCFKALYEVHVAAVLSPAFRPRSPSPPTVILAVKNIQIDRTWQLKTASTDPTIASSWTAGGGQGETVSRLGRGNEPVPTATRSFVQFETLNCLGDAIGESCLVLQPRPGLPSCKRRPCAP